MRNEECKAKIEHEMRNIKACPGCKKQPGHKHCEYWYMFMLHCSECELSSGWCHTPYDAAYIWNRLCEEKEAQNAEARHED